MDSDGSEQNSSNWPIPKFYFQVKWGDKILSFQEVSGLDVESEPIEYRHGDSPEFSSISMPGLKKNSNVTMKKGVFTSGDEFWDWFNQTKLNTVNRETVTISLLDEGGLPTMVWTLANAWPTKISGTDLKTAGNEVAVESLEISHEGLTIANE